MKSIGLTANKLKMIACVSMLIDHIGYILFPGIVAFRAIGRIAMPIFAFYIGQGCRYTKSKLKYFLRIFLLGVFCQIVYTANQLLTKTFYRVNLNILFTFTLSIVICYAYLKLEEVYKKKNIKKIIFHAILLMIVFLAAVRCCRVATIIFGINVSVDYGFIGIVLPVLAVLPFNKFINLAIFSLGVLYYCVTRENLYVWFSLISVILLCFYNGEYGNKKYKNFFYIFYPLHLALLYLISLIF